MANMRIETEPVAQDLFVAAQHADFGQQAIGKLIQDYAGYRNLYEREGASITAKDCLRQVRELQQRIVRADPEHFSFDDGGMSLFSSLINATAVTPRKEAFHSEAPNER